MWSSKLRPEKAEKSLLSYFSPIFYACKLCGIYPHDFEAYREHGILQSSRIGGAIVIIILIFISVAYSLMVAIFRQSTLMTGVSMIGQLVNAILTFAAMAIMIVDLSNAVLKQKNLHAIFNKIDKLDARLQEHHIAKLNNWQVGVQIIAMLVLTIVFEAVIFISTYYYFVQRDDWMSMLWIFASIPTLYNTFDKIWFVGITMALKQRFQALNAALNAIVEQHEYMQRVKENLLAREIVPFRQQVLTKKYQSSGMADYSNVEAVRSLKDYLKHDFTLTEKELKSPAIKIISELSNDYDVVEDKFMFLCQLHSDICDIIKAINNHWSFPILSLMAFGFITTIAQFYFMYIASWDEGVPSLFVSAQSTIISAISLTYLGGKCVTLMFYCWKTKLEGKRTAICFHKCAVAANRNQIYELVNHLSLKLLNHAIDFSAGGFFTLDMNTLFGVLGGLTSYLIIFIQFDLEAKQPKAVHANRTTTTTPMPNTTDITDVTEIY